MNNFKLQSDFNPEGDQPQAIEKLSQGLKNKYKNQTLLGVTGSGKTFTMAKIIEKVQKPTLVVSHNKTLAAQLSTEFKNFFPKNEVHYFVSYYDYYQPEAYLPSTDTYIEKDASINEEIDRLRHAATAALLSQRDVIICASVSCIYNLGPSEEYKRLRITLNKNQQIDRDDVLRELVKIQYTRNDIGFNRSTFRVRGDSLEIFPVYSDKRIIKIDFFGNEIESIKIANFITGEILETPDSIDIFPATHYVAPIESKDSGIRAIKKDLKIRMVELNKADKGIEAQRLKQKTNYDIEMLEEVGYTKGIENYSRYFDGRNPGDAPNSLIGYFPKDFITFIDESHMTVPQIRGMYFGDRARKETLIDYGFRLPSALDNRPLKFDEFEKKMNQTIYVSATPAEYEFKKSKQVAEQLIRPTGLLDPTIEVKPIDGQVDDLIKNIDRTVKNGQRVLVTTLTKQLSEQLTEYLIEKNIKVQYLHSDIVTLERLEILRDLRKGKYDVLVGINLLREGLDLPEVSLVAILDADKEGFLRSETALVQTMGRAARHADGRVIMYADNMTGSMKRAIKETDRRRKIQNAYNKKHGITPKTISKEIDDNYITNKKKPEQKLDLGAIEKRSKEELEGIIKDMENKMQLHAQNLEFEEAAEVRDQVEIIKRKISRQ